MKLDKFDYGFFVLIGLLIIGVANCIRYSVQQTHLYENKQKEYVQEVVTSNMQCKEYLMKIDDSWSKVVSCERKEQ